MEIDWKILVQISALIGSFLFGKMWDGLFERKAKLTAYYGHVSSFKTPGSNGGTDIQVHTHSIVIFNPGKSPANNLKIKHKVLPGYEIYPSIQHEVVNIEGSTEKEIRIDKLVPAQQITISYLYFHPLTFQNVTTQIISDEGFAKILDVFPTPQVPKWRIYILLGFALLGLISAVYVVVNLYISLVK